MLPPLLLPPPAAGQEVATGDDGEDESAAVVVAHGRALFLDSCEWGGLAPGPCRCLLGRLEAELGPRAALPIAERGPFRIAPDEDEPPDLARALDAGVAACRPSPGGAAAR